LFLFLLFFFLRKKYNNIYNINFIINKTYTHTNIYIYVHVYMYKNGKLTSTGIPEIAIYIMNNRMDIIIFKEL